MMKIINGLLHFLIPRASNNHRAYALHLPSISFYIIALLILQIGLTTISKINPSVLGYASNISINDLLADTNEKRQVAGVGSLKINDQLNAAAAAKAADMFAHQYWAHTSPLGKDPWTFISASGYTYVFAGENLARDFGDSRGVVDAWMNSPSHRDNLLNSRYQDVGFAVVNGKYGDLETTLVVQMFGAKPSSPATVKTPEISQPNANVEIKPKLEVPSEPAIKEMEKVTSPAGTFEQTKPPVPEVLNNTTDLQMIAGESNNKINVWTITKTISLIVTAVLILILAIDGLLVYRRKTVRLSGHNMAHMILLIAILVIINLIGRGAIL